MKADLSRSTFDAAKHYRDVRLQQGRVQLDADFNEQVDIVAHRVETETVDVIGQCGAPIHDAAFQLATTVAELPPEQQAAATALGALAKGDFLLSAGRYYVDGILCESAAPLKFSGQAAGDLPGTEPLKDAGLYLAYLDVWARHVTFLDDPLIREVALNGPDTATRNQTVWQVKLVKVGNTGTAPDCAGSFAAYDQAIAEGTGKLAAEADPEAKSKKPCVLPPGGGYRRLENQLYRVEIHTAGSAGGTATFKWSRDNGAVVSGWETTSFADQIRLTQPPPDQVMGFAPGQWVELTDDSNDLHAKPGLLVEVAKVDGELLTLKTPVPANTFLLNPKVRRWDSVNETKITAGNWFALEDGVRVQFTGGTYKTGDYWMIPARTATSAVEWPRSGNAAVFQLPHGVLHHFCRIGFVDFDGSALKVHDCRLLFKPLVEHDEGGDLKLHNRHLHGSGVVCGLQVHCGGADRLTVKIKPGHALDCAGTDILLKSPRTFAAVTRAVELKLLDSTHTGDVLLTLEADTNEQPVFDLRAAPPEPKGAKQILAKILEGTLWMDFYEDCLKPIADFVQANLVNDDPNDQRLVPAKRRRLIAGMNLLVHRGGSPAQRRVWLSQEEHGLLVDLYEGLKDFADDSHTFCGQEDSFAPFPAYPFAPRQIRTGFVAEAVSGVRPLPGGNRVVTWADGTPGKLFVVDVASGELTSAITLSGAVSLTVHDCTVAQFEKQPCLVVASADATQTVLSILRLDTLASLTAPVVLTGGSLSRLETHPRDPETVLGLRKGAGLHFLSLANLASGPLGQPKWSFSAAGHMSVGDDFFCATVVGAVAGAYTALQFGVFRRATADQLLQEVPLNRLNSKFLSGEDGLCFAGSGDSLRLHVVVNPPAGSLAKSVLVLDNPTQPHLTAQLDLTAGEASNTGTGPVHLRALLAGNRVAYALSERNQLFWVTATATTLPAGQTLPSQLNPVAVAAAGGNGEFAVVANRGSQTLTLIPASQFTTAAVTDSALAAYRDAVLAAFESLILPLIQGLKDCLCEHLLLDCMECGEDEFIPLARIEIRNGKVHHICNFDRREVLTFPKVKYWLSAVPIIPLVAFFVEKFCCWVIELPKTGAITGVSTDSTSTFAKATALFFQKDLRTGLSEGLTRTKVLSGQWLKSAGSDFLRSSTPSADAVVKPSEVLNQPAEAAVAGLQAKGVEVTTASAADAGATGSLSPFDGSNLPTDLKAGEKVELFTEGDRVVFFRRKAAERSVPEEIAPTAAAAAPAVAAGDVAELRNLLAEMKWSHARELKLRDEQLAALKLANEKLAAEFAGTAKRLEADVAKLARKPRNRPTG